MIGIKPLERVRLSAPRQYAHPRREPVEIAAVQAKFPRRFSLIAMRACQCLAQPLTLKDFCRLAQVGVARRRRANRQRFFRRIGCEF